GGGGGGFGGNGEITVPKKCVGVIIGKKGDMIKKIQEDSGARVQFRPDEGDPHERICTVAGPDDKVAVATKMINELIRQAQDRNNERDGGRGGRGGLGGRGGCGRFGDRGGSRFDDFGGDQGNFGGGGRDAGGRDRGDYEEEASISVPGDKCGLVIGRGGDSIKEIKDTSGAHVQLLRYPGPNPDEKTFQIKGTRSQIQQAMRLISEKAGIHQGGNGGGGGGPGPGGPPGGFDGGFGGPGPQGGPGGPPQYAPQGWGNTFNAPQHMNPPNKQAADAWAAYYAQYYNQGGQQQQNRPQQPQQQQSTPAPSTGQADYSAAWAEYYR
ncbi:unnamed protein product, partial [Owenia fusiformis]